MRHEKYTCDRCHGVLDKTPPSTGGRWAMHAGYGYCMVSLEGGPDHLCADCRRTIREATEALWKALMPSLHKKEE